ncbi:MAG TPA: hypothetical protein VFQ65_16430 [Kofleriaceae bacterium]|nr:hypothetical protein [Kofleriaceae bacterium]
MTKSKFQNLASTQLESTTGGYGGWYAYHQYAAERYFAREERFAAYHPYAFARFERRFGW